MKGQRARVGIAAAAALLACAGCGFKGALYLPERNATVITHPGQGTQGAQSSGQTQSPAAKGKNKTSAPPPQSPQALPPPSAR
jgi:predicted small lipoprotein YifL